MPAWVLALILGIPMVGILGTITWKYVKPKPEKIVNDPNAAFTELENQIPALRKEYRAVGALLKEGSGGEAGTARAEKLMDDLGNWLAKWDELLEPHFDENGDLPEAMKGYTQTPFPVGQMLQDLSRIKGF